MSELKGNLTEYTSICAEIERLTKVIRGLKKRKTDSLPKPISKPWVIQVGAFGKYLNATRLKKQLQGNGFAAEVQTVNSNGKRLHAVRIVRYEKRNQAENVGKKLKKKYGLDYRILNNPVQ